MSSKAQRFFVCTRKMPERWSYRQHRLLRRPIWNYTICTLHTQALKTCSSILQVEAFGMMLVLLYDMHNPDRVSRIGTIEQRKERKSVRLNAATCNHSRVESTRRSFCNWQRESSQLLRKKYSLSLPRTPTSQGNNSPACYIAVVQHGT